MAHFDDLLIQALEAYLPQLPGQDHSNVEWVLQTLGVLNEQSPDEKAGAAVAPG
jgi:hypothetical protein